MKNIQVLCLLVLFFSVIGCSKVETPAGYADRVVGTYYGTMSHGAQHIACTSKIEKSTETKIRLTITMNQFYYIFGGIDVKNSGDNSYTLYYSDPSGDLSGKVEGNELTYSISSGVLNDLFFGIR